MTVRPGPRVYVSEILNTYFWQLLNTATNLGGTWPRYFVLRGVDIFTVATCRVKHEFAFKGELAC